MSASVQIVGREDRPDGTTLLSAELAALDGWLIDLVVLTDRTPMEVEQVDIRRKVSAPPAAITPAVLRQVSFSRILAEAFGADGLAGRFGRPKGSK